MRTNLLMGNDQKQRLQLFSCSFSGRLFCFASRGLTLKLSLALQDPSSDVIYDISILLPSFWSNKLGHSLVQLVALWASGGWSRKL